MNIDRLDRILLSKEDVELLFQWRDNHKDYVRNFKPVLKEGCIVLQDKKLGTYHMQVFKDEGDKYRYTVYFKDLKTHELVWHKATKVGEIQSTKMQFGNGGKEQYNQSMISLHASLMAYMEYFSDKKEYVEVEDVTVVKQKKKSSKGSQKKSPVKIRKKIYRVNIDKEATVVNERRYKRKTMGWNVAGHWRTYKSGKKVWIASYPKGDKKNIEPKDYKL